MLWCTTRDSLCVLRLLGLLCFGLRCFPFSSQHFQCVEPLHSTHKTQQGLPTIKDRKRREPSSYTPSDRKTKRNSTGRFVHIRPIQIKKSCTNTIHYNKTTQHTAVQQSGKRYYTMTTLHQPATTTQAHGTHAVCGNPRSHVFSHSHCVLTLHYPNRYNASDTSSTISTACWLLEYSVCVGGCGFVTMVSHQFRPR